MTNEDLTPEQYNSQPGLPELLRLPEGNDGVWALSKMMSALSVRIRSRLPDKYKDIID